MHLNDKVQQLKDYFSNDFISKVEKICSKPYPAYIVLAALMVASPFYMKKYIHDTWQKEVAEPLMKIQREGWRLDEIQEQKEGELILKIIKDRIEFEKKMYGK